MIIHTFTNTQEFNTYLFKTQSNFKMMRFDKQVIRYLKFKRQAINQFAYHNAKQYISLGNEYAWPSVHQLSLVGLEVLIFLYLYFWIYVIITYIIIITYLGKIKPPFSVLLFKKRFICWWNHFLETYFSSSVPNMNLC